jgi:hypothetical protein
VIVSAGNETGRANEFVMVGLTCVEEMCIHAVEPKASQAVRQHLLPMMNVSDTNDGFIIYLFNLV